MAEVGTRGGPADRKTGAGVKYTGIAGVNDGDVVIETLDVTDFDTFVLKSSAGAMDVFVDLGDGNFIGPHNFADLSATTSDPVVVTAAAKTYGWRGPFEKIQVQQNGATAVTGAILRMQRIAG